MSGANKTLELMAQIIFETISRYLAPAARARYLMTCFFRNTLSIAEMEELDDWVLANDRNMELFESWIDKSISDPSLAFLEEKTNKWFARGTFEYNLAAFFIFCLSAWLIHLAVQWEQHNNPIIMAGEGNAAKEFRMFTRTAPADSNLSVILPDSSTVQLSPNASVNYPMKFRDTRIITLKGDALFDVSGSHKARLYINVKEFNVRIPSGAARITAAMAGDSIRLDAINADILFEAGKDSWQLSPGQSALFANGKWTPLNF